MLETPSYAREPHRDLGIAFGSFDVLDNAVDQFSGAAARITSFKRYHGLAIERYPKLRRLENIAYIQVCSHPYRSAVYLDTHTHSIPIERVEIYSYSSDDSLAAMI